MKFSLAIVALVAVFALAKADSTIPNFDAQFKTLADNLEAVAKKFEELSGLKTEFDKEKFLNFLKSTSHKLTEEFKNISEKLQKDSKFIPEELKKRYDELIKQINETIKGLNSPEVQAKYQKLQETLNTSVKKVGDSVTDLTKSFGLTVPPSIRRALDEIYEELQKTSKNIADKSQKILEGIQDELKKKND